MLDQSGHIPSMSGAIPLGRGLMPEELADFKAKGREWSRLYKEKRRKDFSLEQIEERKLKNRLRQKRFRERQKSREQEETERLAGSMHQLGDHQQQDQHSQTPQQEGYEHAQLQYAAPQMAQQTEHHAEVPDDLMEQQQQQQQGPVETLVEKRKRLGRERQARFREKKRIRTSHSGSQAGNVTESSQPGLAASPQSQQQLPEQQQHEIMTLAELQKMSAQLSGYYTGLTQGLTQEEHQAVMRFFLDGLREDLGDEIFAGVGFYGIADAHAQAAAAHVHYMQGLDLQALQQAAAASGHLQPGELPAGMHAAQVDAAGQVQGHLHGQLDPQMAGQAQAGEITQAQMQAQFEQYHRQLAEAQQADMAHHHEETYEAGQTGQANTTASPKPDPAQHIPASMEGHPERMMYQQEGVNQGALPQSEHMHFVDSEQHEA